MDENDAAAWKKKVLKIKCNEKSMDNTVGSKMLSWLTGSVAKASDTASCDVALLLLLNPKETKDYKDV